MDTRSIENLPEVVLFDWDGTLVDSSAFLLNAHNHVRESMRLPVWSREEYHGVSGFSTKESYARIYGANAEHAEFILYEYVRNNHLEQLDTLRHALDLVSRLQELGIALGVVSNKRHEYLLREIEHLGWDSYFGVCVGAGEAERDKPAPDSIYLACEALQVGPDSGRTWYVGDTETDLIASSSAGCGAVLLLHGKDGKGLVEKYKPIHVFNGCEDFLASLPKTVAHAL